MTAARATVLDIVPWTYGFIHSWVLRWVLQDPDLAEPVLEEAFGNDLPGPHRVTSDVVREKVLKRSRADLAFSIADATGEEHSIVLETKVEDPYRPEQITEHAKRGERALLYLPGATRLVVDAFAGRAAWNRLDGGQLAAALQTRVNDPLITPYLSAVAIEHARLDRARELVRDGNFDIGEGPGTAKTVIDMAWLAEVKSELAQQAVAEDVSPEMSFRAVGYDRGIYWDGSRRTINAAAEDAAGDLFVEIFADIRNEKHAVALKAGGPTPGARAAAYDAAVRSAKPAEGWWKCDRRVSKNSVTVWKIELTRQPIDVAAAHAILAARAIRAITR